MSEERIERGLHAYADHVQLTTTMVSAGDIRHRAARRRRRRATGAAFTAVLIAVIGVGYSLGRQPPMTPSVPPSPSVTTLLPTRTPNTSPPASNPPTSNPPTTNTVTSDVSELRRLGIGIGRSVLIDVADDGLDRWLQIGAGGVVDFTGTTKDDSTMMSLQPAPVREKNRVVIKPPSYNKDPGPGSCIADTPETALTLTSCKPGDASQTWQIVPSGDSGQFELVGRYGPIRVDNGRILTTGAGFAGLQTIPFPT